MNTENVQNMQTQEQDQSPSKKLSLIEKQVAKAYITPGKTFQNGRQSYLKVKPDVQPTTADVAASIILKNPNVMRYMEAILDKQDQTISLTREKVLQAMSNIAEKAEKAEKLQTALNSYKEYSTLAGHYKPGESDLSDYEGVIKSLTVNIQDNSTTIYGGSSESSKDNTDASEQVVDI